MMLSFAEYPNVTYCFTVRRPAISMDYQMNFTGSRSVEERYCIDPVVDADDYEIIRSAARPGFSHRPNHDFQYSMFQTPDGSYVQAKEVFGALRASFKFIVPHAILLTKVRELMLAQHVLYEQDSFASKPKPHEMAVEFDDQDDRRSTKMQRVKFWKSVLGGLNHINRRELKRRLVNAHKDHTLEPKEGETCQDYLYRHASRYGNEKDGRKFESPTKSKKRRQDDQREALKWNKPLPATPDGNKKGDKDDLIKLWDDVLETECLPEDAELEDIFDRMMISNEDGFDMEETETGQMERRQNRIAKPRQLGDWITITVDGEKRTITCNCERCNRTGKCHWVACLEVIQFGRVPPARCLTADEGVGWFAKVHAAKVAMWETNIKV